MSKKNESNLTESKSKESEVQELPKEEGLRLEKLKANWEKKVPILARTPRKVITIVNTNNYPLFIKYKGEPKRMSPGERLIRIDINLVSDYYKPGVQIRKEVI